MSSFLFLLNPPKSTPAGPCGGCVSAQRQRKEWCPTHAPGKPWGSQVRGEPSQVSEGLPPPSPQTRGQSLLPAPSGGGDLSQSWKRAAYLPWLGFEQACPEAWVAPTQGNKQYPESPFSDPCSWKRHDVKSLHILRFWLYNALSYYFQMFLLIILA